MVQAPIANPTSAAAKDRLPQPPFPFLPGAALFCVAFFFLPSRSGLTPHSSLSFSTSPLLLAPLLLLSLVLSSSSSPACSTTLESSAFPSPLLLPFLPFSHTLLFPLPSSLQQGVNFCLSALGSTSPIIDSREHLFCIVVSHSFCMYCLRKR
ncbi:hypothetical protein I7I48_02759 [Histoplasma ohiense]|nr:hypothetical protein I7I48_02759 [Histoplasma ohiense (nom. inval.)]